MPLLALTLLLYCKATGGTANTRDSEFVKWLENGGVDLSGLEIATFPEAEGGRGLRTTKDIANKAVMLQVPTKLALTSDHAAEIVPKLSEIESRALFRPCERLAIVLAQIKVHIMLHAQNSSSKLPTIAEKWAPYINTLPDSRELYLPSLLQDTGRSMRQTHRPDENTRAKDEQYNRVAESVMGIFQSTPTTWSAVQHRFKTQTESMGLIHPFAFEHFAEMNISTDDPAESKKRRGEIIAETLQWADAVVRSRAWSLRHDVCALVPLADMLNHRPEQGLLVDTPDSWMVESARSYKAGEQIFDSYFWPPKPPPKQGKGEGEGTGAAVSREAALELQQGKNFPCELDTLWEYGFTHAQKAFLPCMYLDLDMQLERIDFTDQRRKTMESLQISEKGSFTLHLPVTDEQRVIPPLMWHMMRVASCKKPDLDSLQGLAQEAQQGRESEVVRVEGAEERMVQRLEYMSITSEFRALQMMGKMFSSFEDQYGDEDGVSSALAAAKVQKRAFAQAKKTLQQAEKASADDASALELENARHYEAMYRRLLVVAEAAVMMREGERTVLRAARAEVRYGWYNWWYHVLKSEELKMLLIGIPVFGGGLIVVCFLFYKLAGRWESALKGEKTKGKKRD